MRPSPPQLFQFASTFGHQTSRKQKLGPRLAPPSAISSLYQPCNSRALRLIEVCLACIRPHHPFRAILERDNFDSPRVPVPRQFCHLRSELLYSDRHPSILLASDSVERQDMPASGAYPSANFLIG